MWYKRYGYKQPNTAGGVDNSSRTIAAQFGFIMGGVVLSLVFQSSVFLGFGLSIAIILFLYDLFSSGNQKDSFKNDRRSMHIENARRSAQDEKYLESIDFFRRAEIYGKLSKLEQYELDEIKQKLKNADAK